MKHRIKIFLYLILRVIYKDINKTLEPYTLKELFLYAFKQKIRGYNRNIPWPVHFTSQIKCPEKIQRGTTYPGFGMSSYIDGRNGIIFEDNVITGPKVSIISQNHDLMDFGSYTNSKPIIIRKNSWLTTGCIILPETELGEHTIVAAGAIVTKSFLEGNQVIGGNPAKVLKKIAPYKNK